MSEIDQERIGSANPLGNEETEYGQLRIAEKANMPASDSSVATAVSTQVQLPTPRFTQVQEHTGTTEHLAARCPMPTLDPETPEMKQILATLRAEWTRLVTEFRWEGQSVEDTAARMIPLLNVGPVEQWKAVLIPFLYEIDRGGALIPVWLNVIEQGDPADLPPDANPADTQIGRARRFAILMLGNYKMMGIAGLRKTSKLAKSITNGNISSERGVAEILGDLAIDPNTSLYATQSLVKHATVPAIQALITALKHAKGWAKVDVIEACLELKQEQLYDLLIASGLDNAPGLESYIATPIYRVVPLENYLSGEGKVSPRLLEQSALIFSQVLQDNTNPPPATAEIGAVPVIFERHLPTLAQALFRGARHYALWQNTVAIHRLSLMLGRYWQEVSQGRIKDIRIIDQIYQCAPLMNEIEPWMQGQGRDTLLNTLANPDEEVLIPTIKVLGELRDSRAASLLITCLNAITELKDRSHALTIGAMCQTLGQLGHVQALPSLQQLLDRTILVASRTHQSKLKDNLPVGDPEIPGSIVYAAIIHAYGLLGDRSALESVVLATRDLDPYVRSQALDAIRRLDPRGEDRRSRTAIREALHDPNESIIHSASQLVVYYQDNEAVPALRQLTETRPELAHIGQDTLRQLGQ
jgi:HEAT repeat protein